MLFRSGDIVKYQFYGGHFRKWLSFRLFGQVQLIEMCFIGFLAPENVCLALKIKALRHLEVEILGNTRFMVFILEKGCHFIFLARFSISKCVSFDSLSLKMYVQHLKSKLYVIQKQRYWEISDLWRPFFKMAAKDLSPTWIS